jgi:hypothetical protein
MSVGLCCLSLDSKLPEGRKMGTLEVDSLIPRIVPCTQETLKRFVELINETGLLGRTLSSGKP